MIKAANQAMNAVIGNVDITDEELIISAEALVNSRPLTYQSASPEDDPPLTPNHFLDRQAGGQFAWWIQYKAKVETPSRNYKTFLALLDAWLAPRIKRSEKIE